MKLLLPPSFFLLFCWATPAIGHAAAAPATTRRRVQASSSTTTTTTTSLIPNLLSAEMMIIDDATKLQVTVTYQGDSYVALAFSLDKLMAGSFAVIGLPDGSNGGSGNVAKYELIGQTTPIKMAADRQTLTDTSVTSDGTTTTLKFTKLLKEADEVAINPNGDNIFLYAVGPDNLPDQLQLHKRRGDVTVNFATGVSAVSDPNEYKTLWLCHGIFLALAWMILIPIGTGCSVARALLPASSTPVAWWFQLHRSLNMCGVILTMIGGAIAVYIIQKEQGESAQHFTQKPHHKIGLAVLLIAVVNALVGIFRPHAPHAAPSAVAMVDRDDDDDVDDVDHESNKAAAAATAPAAAPHKTPARVAFEYGHRILGLSAIILAWFNVGSGAELMHIKYVDDIADYSRPAWIILAVIAALILILGVVGRRKQEK